MLLIRAIYMLEKLIQPEDFHQESTSPNDDDTRNFRRFAVRDQLTEILDVDENPYESPNLLDGVAFDLRKIQMLKDSGPKMKLVPIVEMTNLYLREWARDMCMYAFVLPQVGDAQLTVEKVITEKEYEEIKRGASVQDFSTANNDTPFPENHFNDFTEHANQKRYVLCKGQKGPVILPYRCGDMNFVYAYAKGDAQEKLRSVFLELFDSGLIEDFKQKLMPEFKHKPRTAKERNETIEEMDLVELVEGLPKGLKEGILRAGIMCIELSDGCEERCKGCAFNANGKVTKRFSGSSVREFIDRYPAALNGYSVLCFATDPLDHPEYAQIMEHALENGKILFTSTTVPYGREAALLNLIDILKKYGMMNGRNLRLSVMPENIMRATLLDVMILAASGNYDYQVNNLLG
jgi:hypothetical protein